jgi:hypothetical protein
MAQDPIKDRKKIKEFKKEERKEIDKRVKSMPTVEGYSDFSKSKATIDPRQARPSSYERPSTLSSPSQNYVQPLYKRLDTPLAPTPEPQVEGYRDFSKSKGI